MVITASTSMFFFPLDLYIIVQKCVKWSKTIGGPRGRQGHFSLPLGVMFFIFMQLLRIIGQNNRLVPPPFGNPGPVTENIFCVFLVQEKTKLS